MIKYKNYIIDWGLIGFSYCSFEDLDKHGINVNVHYCYVETLEKCKQEIDELIQTGKK